MFLDRLFNQTDAPLLEQTLKFSAARHKLIAENIVNVSTPNYRQKDLSVAKFQKLLRQRVEDRNRSGPGSVGFDDVVGSVDNPRADILFHDNNNRSMEQLMTDEAKNALMHNMTIELLRKQFQTMEMALRERVS